MKLYMHFNISANCTPNTQPNPNPHAWHARNRPDPEHTITNTKIHILPRNVRICVCAYVIWSGVSVCAHTSESEGAQTADYDASWPHALCLNFGSDNSVRVGVEGSTTNRLRAVSAGCLFGRRGCRSIYRSIVSHRREVTSWYLIILTLRGCRWRPRLWKPIAVITQCTQCHAADTRSCRSNNQVIMAIASVQYGAEPHQQLLDLFGSVLAPANSARVIAAVPKPGSSQQCCDNLIRQQCARLPSQCKQAKPIDWLSLWSVRRVLDISGVRHYWNNIFRTGITVKTFSITSWSSTFLNIDIWRYYHSQNI